VTSAVKMHMVHIQCFIRFIQEFLWQHLTIDPITLQRFIFCGEFFQKTNVWSNITFCTIKLPKIFKLIVMFLDINVQANSQHIKGY
jgi:hypothetical protein